MYLPTDSFMLLSLINTKLRDGFENLEELASAEDFSADEVKARLLEIGYVYDEKQNRFTNNI